MTVQTLLSVKEAASYLGVHPCTVRRLERKEDLPSIRGRGLGIRFKKEEIDSWLENRRTRPLPHFGQPPQALTLPPVCHIKGSHGKTGGTCEMAKAKSKTRLNFGYGAIYQRKKADGSSQWYLDYRDADGKRIQRVASRASSPEEAELALRQAVLAEAGPVPGSAKALGRIKFTEFSRIFLNDYSMSVKRSWRSDKSRLKILDQFFGDTYLDEITPLSITKVIRWRIESGNSKSTSNRYLALLKKMFNVAIDEEYLRENPARKAKKYSEKDCTNDRVFSEEEESKLMKASSPRLRSVIFVVLQTGLRLGEVLSLKWELIDFENKMLTVERTKSGKPLMIPISGDLWEELKRLRSLDGTSTYVFQNPKTGKPIKTTRTAFEGACRRAEITGLTFHRLRHTVASRLIERHADIEEVRSLLGHSSIAITQRYVHATDDRRRAAVELLSKKAPEEPQKGEKVLHGCDTEGKKGEAPAQPKLVSYGFSVN
jgi:excisionase family DNA binding protein